MSYKVRLDVFEGPLDLLLHLINRLEIDIYDIPMAQLTDQYLKHLQAMRVLRLDELSEYLVLAATLIEIKSKTLLPRHEDEALEDIDDYDDEDDPRDELVQRLIDYRKYKEAAESLKQSADDRAEHFTKVPEQLAQISEVVAVDQEQPLNVFDLIGAFQKMMERNRLRAPLTASITKSEQSVEEHMIEIIDRLTKNGGKCHFDDLFDEQDVSTIVMTFISLLELMLRGDIAVEQSNNFSDLMIMMTLGGEGDA